MTLFTASVFMVGPPFPVAVVCGASISARLSTSLPSRDSSKLKPAILDTVNRAKNVNQADFGVGDVVFDIARREGRLDQGCQLNYKLRRKWSS